jgi:hypothetical protein
MLQFLRYIKHYAPLLRLSTEVLYNQQEAGSAAQLLRGRASFLTPDRLPVVGKSAKFANLYFNFGMLNGSIENYVRSSEIVKD